MCLEAMRGGQVPSFLSDAGANIIRLCKGEIFLIQ